MAYLSVGNTSANANGAAFASKKLAFGLMFLEQRRLAHQSNAVQLLSNPRGILRQLPRQGKLLRDEVAAFPPRPLALSAHHARGLSSFGVAQHLRIHLAFLFDGGVIPQRHKRHGQKARPAQRRYAQRVC